MPDAAWHAVHEFANLDTAPREALHLAAVLCLETGHLLEAISFADRLIAGRPADADAHLLRGQALRENGRFADARAVFEQVAALREPDAALHFNLGLLHHRAGDLAASESAYRAALGHAPESAAAWNNLGLLFDDAGRPDDARAAFDRSIALAPGVSATYSNLGACLAGQGRYAAAAAHAKALELDPRNIGARINLGVAQLEQGAVDAARRSFDAALAQGPRNRDAADNRLYLDIYAETDPARIYARHHAWVQEQHPAVHASAHAPRKPLKVGYVSADFRRHSVSFFIEALLRNHGPRQVDVHCFSDVAQPDAVTAKLRALVPDPEKNWFDVAGWDDDRLRQLIRDAGIDVLVDLSGHTNGNRLAMFARRAAPRQVTALGYPSTTGVAAMDFRFCDIITDPPATDSYSTETLLRLHALHCFSPPEGAPEPSELPSLARRHLTFGSFNKLAKISDETVRLWAAVLDAFPGSRLVLKTKPLVEAETRAALAARFSACRIAKDRLDLRGWAAADADHLAAYHEIDVALDTYPYNGTTTTCEALWMGVPVLSMSGRGHASRVGASLLASAGLSEWHAESEQNLREFAVRMLSNPKELAALRRGLRAQIKSSRLCDGSAYARDVESAFRAMYE